MIKETLSNYSELVYILKMIVGQSFILTKISEIKPYSQGIRFGSGGALAVIKPGTLLEIWKVVEACNEAGTAIIMQAANTGLTGGSTPDGNNYDRPVVIINTMRMSQIHLIDSANQVVAFPGSTLFDLEERLAKYGRQTHSVIGSSCIGASIIGGVCNNSGGALVQRGPAYTELSLFAHIDEARKLSLVNNLGINLGDTTEEILTNLEQKNYTEEDIKPSKKIASDNEYQQIVRDINSSRPARYNNDPRLLHEASGCAGKLVVFAVRLDTFPKAINERVFYIGTNTPKVMTKIRHDILSTFKNLPVSGEYFDSQCYDVSKKYGKDIFLVINKLGSKIIPRLFSFKRYVDRIANHFFFLPNKLSDHLMQFLSYLWPNHLPKRMEIFRSHYQLHFILETNNEGVDEAQAYLNNFFKENEGNFFVCSDEEAKKATLHRFVIGGAINRYYLTQGSKSGKMISIDVALRRDEKNWAQKVPSSVNDKISEKFSYGHFFCHVLHEIYITKKDVDHVSTKKQILDFFDSRGAEYPAEHNVGHEYIAKDSLKTFYKECDPTNTFNPGIGKTSKFRNWS